MVDSLRICPSWLAPTLDNAIRRLIHNPEKILSVYIESGQTVLDLGYGPGTFTISMAKLVGKSGKVIAVDVQDEMLQMVRMKASKEGLESRIITHKSEPNESASLIKLISPWLSLWSMKCQMEKHFSGDSLHSQIKRQTANR